MKKALLFAVVALTGCGHIRAYRYAKGFDSGFTDYKKVKEQEYIGAWRSGYLSAILFQAAFGNLGQK